MSKPEVKVFTKDNPVTKLDLWNCFRGKRNFRRVQVDEAKSIIGANAPRYLKSKGYLLQYESRGVEYYDLSDDGRIWLMEGFKRHLLNHPEIKPQAKHLPSALRNLA